MTKKEEINIDEEYEKLCPPSKRKCLFDTEEEYAILRKQIMSLPKNSYNESELPFAGIRLQKEKPQKIEHKEESSINEQDNIFYIKNNAMQGNNCFAYGYYKTDSQKFILMKGSRWSLDVENKYQCTLSEYIRRKYIKNNCEIIDGQYQQTCDIICDSPDEAAKFVLGKIANGWLEWKDKDGNTLKDTLTKEGKLHH